MSFLGWTFLFGIVATVGPVLAHLLAKPRFRRLPFTMLQFLRSSQTESHSRRRLRDLLILLLRCAIIVLIALLFAQPILYIKPESKYTRHIYYMGLDNSTSMSYTDGSSSYFEQMKDSVVEHIVSAESDAVFNICPLVSGDWTQGLTKQQTLAEVKALKIMPGSADVDAFLSGLRNSIRTVNPDDEVSVLLVSDFTPQILKQFLNVQESASIDNLRYKTIVSSKPVNNASIVHAETADATLNGLTINVTVANHDRTSRNRQLSAKVEGNKISTTDLELLPNQVRVFPLQVDLNFNTDQQLFLPVELTLSSGDGLEVDDRFYLAVRLPRQKHTNVLLVEAVEDEMFLLDIAMQTLSGRSSARLIGVRRIMIDDLSSSSLDWADVLVCSQIAERLGRMAVTLSSFVEAGGRAVFFITGEPASAAARQLWQQGILAALPTKYIQEQTYAEVSPCEKLFFGVDNIAAKAMSNYRIDQMPLAGYWDCDRHSESKCLWRYQNGEDLICLKQLGNGTSILINTSADGSLGSLTKSGVSVALCQYLLGDNNQIRDYSFTCNERVVLPAVDVDVDSARQKQLWIQNCDGGRRRAVLTESLISLPDPGGVGWVKTLSEPAIYAGINLPGDETDMSKPVALEVDNALNRVFSIGKRSNMASADTFSIKEQRPLWKILVWAIIALLLIESAVANRLRR